MGKKKTKKTPGHRVQATEWHQVPVSSPQTARIPMPVSGVGDKVFLRGDPECLEDSPENRARLLKQLGKSGSVIELNLKGTFGFATFESEDVAQHAIGKIHVFRRQNGTDAKIFVQSYTGHQRQPIGNHSVAKHNATDMSGEMNSFVKWDLTVNGKGYGSLPLAESSTVWASKSRKISVVVVLRNMNNSYALKTSKVGLVIYPRGAATYVWGDRPRFGSVLQQLSGHTSISFAVEPNEIRTLTARLYVETDHGTVRTLFRIHVATDEMLADTLSGAEHGDDGLSAQDDFDAKGVWDEQDRLIVAAFPPGRPNLSHIHTEVFTEWEKKIGKYPIPHDVQRAVDANNFFSGFNAWQVEETHRDRMHMLLYVEEAAQVKAMRRFDLANTELSSYRDAQTQEECHRIHVPGLAERRPSLLRSDVVYAWIPGSTDVEYEGYIHVLERDTIGVIFCKDFGVRTGHQKKFHVRFKFARLQLRRQHQAIDNTINEILWPNHSPDVSSACSPKDLTWSDAAVERDPQQSQAVADVLNLLYCSNPLPFVLRGAYGTGKTRTLCEIAWQALLAEDVDMPILICAESNGAADKITELLGAADRFGKERSRPGVSEHARDKQRLFRFNAMHRSPFSVPQRIADHCIYDKDVNVYRIPDKRTFMNGTIDIVVTTYDNASVLYGLGLQGQFRIILCDESAQSLESKVLNALQLADTSTVCVLAGDDKQIAPRVISKSAQHHGLQKSIIVRYVEHFRQRAKKFRDVLSSPFGCMLCRNYRSNKQILHVASELFYEGRLQPQKREPSPLENWHALPKWFVTA